MMRLAITLLVAPVTVAFSVSASASCTLIDGSTTDFGACRSVYGETRDDDGVGNRQTLGHFNSIYKWSDDDISWETWSYEAIALRNSGEASLSAFTTVDLLDHSEPPTLVSTKLGTATYRGRSTGVYALATPLGGQVGAIAGNVELTADFTGDGLTGKFYGFSILLGAATGDGWQRIPASITVAGRLLNDGVWAPGQLASDLMFPGHSRTWRVKRNQVPSLTPEHPEFSVKAHFIKNATEMVGTIETISPLAAEQGASSGLLSLSLSFGADTMTMPAPLSPAVGLQIGEPATSSGATTLSSTLYRDTATNRSSVMDGFYIASLSSDGSGGYGTGGFQATYVLDGTEHTIDFEGTDFGADTNSSNSYFTQLENGARFWLWSFPNNKSWTGSHYTQYAFNNWLPGGLRSYITSGVTTNASDFPSGTATYIAEMYGEMFDNKVGSLAWNRSRTHAFGYVALTADFVDASIAGRIFNIRTRGPSDAQYSDVSTTSRFDIDNGRLNKRGLFTADLIGVEEDSSILPGDSVSGFEGGILGAFYGPNATEIAGVLNAKRTGNNLDQEFIGRFGGNRAVGAEAIVTGVDRLVEEHRTVLVADDGMAQVRRTASGWVVTVDGDTVEFSDSDFNGHPQLRNSYTKMIGTDKAATLWSVTRGFRGSPEFDYFDVKRWGYTNLVAEADVSTLEVEDYISSKIFWTVNGDQTPAGSMPGAGGASYDGRMYAYSWASDDATLTGGSDWYKGKIKLSADFAEARVSGVVSELEKRPSTAESFSSEAFLAATGGATFSASIGGNRLTANDFAGTGALAGFQNGSIEGAFYGPAAEEVGGIISATDNTHNQLLMGYFGADKE